MLLAAGLSPALQQIAVLDALRVGEVNRAREVHWCASGKVINVGLALHQLTAGNDQISARTLSVLGGSTGDAIERQVAALGATGRWIRTASPTRVCTTLLDRANGLTTEIVENARPISAAELDEFRRAFIEESSNAHVVVLTGSLPDGAPPTFLADLLPLTPAKAVLDFRGPALLSALAHRPFLIKPNREELGQTVQQPLNSELELLSAMRQLNERGAEHVLVTQGDQRVWLTSRSETWYADPPSVGVVNPIGCGDCLAAGLAWSLASGDGLQAALAHGLAAAALNAQDLLPARFTLEQVRSLAAQIRVQRA